MGADAQGLFHSTVEDAGEHLPLVRDDMRKRTRRTVCCLFSGVEFDRGSRRGPRLQDSPRRAWRADMINFALLTFFSCISSAFGFGLLRGLSAGGGLLGMGIRR
jgi:hypothetical protein